MQTRYYDPEVGRFISADDVSYLAPGSIFGLNLYAYCGNNPVMGYDPIGTWDWGKVADWISTLSGLIHPTKSIVILGSLTAAICQGEWNLLVEDAKNGCFNPFNMDAGVALSSNVFSFYKGEAVIRHSIPGATSCQIFGNIFLNVSVKNNAYGLETLNHEFGHGIQEKMMGLNYFDRVVFFSLGTFDLGLSDKVYFSFPWERTADFFGGVNRGSGYKNGSLGWALAENLLGSIVVPFYLWLGF